MVGLVAMGLLGWTTGATGDATKSAAPLSRIGPAPEFTLTTQEGARRSLRDFHRKVVAVTFIYASCADTCPLLTAKMVGLQAELGPEFGTRVFFVAVTWIPTATPQRRSSVMLRPTGRTLLAGRSSRGRQRRSAT